MEDYGILDPKNLVLGLISNGNFIQVSYPLLRSLEGDCVSTIVLTSYISNYQYYEHEDNLNSDGSFFSHVIDFEQLTGINDYFQRKAIQKLESLGLLTSFLRGSPPSRFIKLNFNAIYSLLSKNLKNINKVVNIPKDNKTIIFYNNINNINNVSIIYSIKEYYLILSNYDNVPLNIAEFMFFWSKLCFKLDINFKWNSKQYGYIRGFIINNKKPIDYSKILNYCTNTKVNDTISLFGCIKEYYKTPERDPSTILSAYELLFQHNFFNK
jgi:hypothetical protein